MSYLKIFPRTMVMHSDGMDGYVGRMRCDFEQYGHMYYSHDTDVRLTYSMSSELKWCIELGELKTKLTGFEGFVHALNHYLFDVLRFDPLSQWYKPSEAQFEYQFKPVYFDMGSQKFISKK